jgi:Bacteriophage tail sheath protein
MTVHPAPGLYVERPQPSPPIVGVPMDVAGFVGIAERGPLDVAVALDGWPAFVDRFGGFLANAFLAYAVRGFFENGGRRCHVVRVAAPSVEADLDTAAAQPADRLSSIVTSADGFAAGALVTMTQSVAAVTAGPQPADRMSSQVIDARGFADGSLVVLRQAGKPVSFNQVKHLDVTLNWIDWVEALAPDLNLNQPFQLSTIRTDRRILGSVAGSTFVWRHALDPRFDLALPVRFAAGASAASAELPDEDGLPLLRVSAASPGVWGDRVRVRLVRSTTAVTASVARPVPDTPDQLSVGGLSDMPIGATAEIHQLGATAVRRVIAGHDARQRRLVWDAPLPAAFDLAGAASGAKPITIRRLGFSLSVLVDNRIVEVFDKLSLPSATDAANTPVNDQSRYIRVERLGTAGAIQYPWPDPSLPLLRSGVTTLQGGRDGIAMLRDTDVIGDDSLPERRGLRVFELVDEPAALAIPDALIESTPPVEYAPPPTEEPDPCALEPVLEPAAAPPAPTPVESAPDFSASVIAAMQDALVAHCEGRHDRIALLDPPRRRDLGDPYAFDPLVSWRERFDTTFAAVYFPWLLVADPLAGPRGVVKAVPPSGHVAGVIARTDASTGVQSAPANLALTWVVGVPRQVGAADQEYLNPLAINCIRTFSGRGIRVYGARTLSSLPDWRYLNVRRLLILIEKSLARALAWAVFEPNSVAFARLVVGQIEAFLEAMWERRGLAGRTPDEAFYVAARSPPVAADAGQFIVEIGVAPVIPAEFVVLRLARSVDRLEFAELTQPTESA